MLRRLGFLAYLASLPLAATTIYPQQTTVTLNPGDSLAFAFSAAGYAANAALFGASASPDSVRFALSTTDLSGAFDFRAALLAYDDSADVQFSNEAVTEGYFVGSRYTGETSVASAAVNLSPADSAAIFIRQNALLLLQNTGAAVNLGLPPYSLAQDMQITLSGRTSSGGVLSVGGLVTSVSLNRAETYSVFANSSYSPLRAPVSDAPEPQTWFLFAAGAGALLLLGRRRR